MFYLLGFVEKIMYIETSLSLSLHLHETKKEDDHFFFLHCINEFVMISMI